MGGEMTDSERAERVAEALGLSPTVEQIRKVNDIYQLPPITRLLSELDRVTATALAHRNAAGIAGQERDAAIARAEKAEAEHGATLGLISAEMDCQPSDTEDLVEAVRLCVQERDAAIDTSQKHVDEIEKLRHELERVTAERDAVSMAVEESIRLADFLYEAAEGGAGFSDHWGGREAQAVEPLRDVVAFKDRTLAHNKMLLESNGEFLRERDAALAQVKQLRAALGKLRECLFGSLPRPGPRDSDWERHAFGVLEAALATEPKT